MSELTVIRHKGRKEAFVIPKWLAEDIIGKLELEGYTLDNVFDESVEAGQP